MPYTVVPTYPGPDTYPGVNTYPGASWFEYLDPGPSEPGLRHATITAHAGPVYAVAPISEVSWDHAIALGSGQIMGLRGSVVWDDPTQLSTLDDTWVREAGHYVDVEWTEEGKGTTRIITGRVDESEGSTADLQATSSLTDWTSRLETQLDLRPVGYYMPANPLLTGAVKRKPGLFSWWFTHQALTRAGFYPGQALMTYSVFYVSMCGSAWPVPDPNHAFSGLGECRQVYRASDNSVAPIPVQGDDQPCTSDVYGLYLTRATSSSLPWQLTVDLGTRSPSGGDTGRARMRVHPSGDGPGIGLDWTPTHVRVIRYNVSGTTMQLGSYPRLRNGLYPMRWSLVARSDGTARLLCEDDSSGNRTHEEVATLAATGVPMPTGSTRCSVLIESEGIIGAVQVARADSSYHVERVVGAKILRTPLAYALARSLIAWDYVEPRAAGDILTLQADAERGLRGMPLCQWIDHDGKFINADFASLVDGALNPSGEEVEHYIGPDQTTALDNLYWTAPGKGPWRSQSVTYIAMRRKGDGATVPSHLLAQGRQETIERGGDYEIILHPSEGEIWLEPELRPYLAGNPYPAGTYPHPVNLAKWFDRARGTWVGGSRRDEDGEATGWITPGDITEWSLDSNGFVRNALTMVDPRTVIISGTVATPSGLDMSTMPSEASAGLPEPRKQQPLAQLRGYAKAVKRDSAVNVTVTGSDRHPDSVHDAGMFVQRDAHAQYIASELAEALTDPVEVIRVVCEVNPWVKVGQVAEVWFRRPDGSTLMVRGAVVRASGSTSSASMTLELAVISKAVQEPAEPLPPMPDPVPAPARPINPPPGTDPPPYDLS